jgi:PAP2 superfamily protein
VTLLARPSDVEVKDGSAPPHRFNVALAATLAFIAVYMAVGLTVLPDGVSGDPKQGPLVLVACLFPVLGTVIARRLRTGESYPVAWRRTVTWGGFASLAVFAVLTQVFFGAFMAWKAHLPSWGHFAADPALARLDAALHGGRDLWILFTPILRSRPALLAADFIYSCFLPMLCLVVGWRAWAQDYRFFLAFALCWILLGTGLALAFHSAGPIFFHEVTGDDRFLPLIAFLDAAPGLQTNETRAILWRAYAQGFPSSISAFPSMHIAMPALFAIALGRVSRRLGWALWVLTALTSLATVILGWHYAIDVYVAIGGAWACWWLAGRIGGWR